MIRFSRISSQGKPKQLRNLNMLPFLLKTSHYSTTSKCKQPSVASCTSSLNPRQPRNLNLLPFLSWTSVINVFSFFFVSNSRQNKEGHEIKANPQQTFFHFLLAEPQKIKETKRSFLPLQNLTQQHNKGHKIKATINSSSCTSSLNPRQPRNLNLLPFLS